VNRQAMRSPTTANAELPASRGVLQRKCACGNHTAAGGECEECARKKPSLQRKSANENAVAEVPQIVHEVLRSSGQPLDAATRAFFEPRLGHDFSRVRVHTDTRAAESAQAVGAIAYTVGREVVFGPGSFQPNTLVGRQLLAHELTHVLQQHSVADAPTADVRAIDPDGNLESEAQVAGNDIHGGIALGTTPSLQRALQRQSPPGSRSGASRPLHVTEVQVNQNTQQRVTATFSNGALKVTNVRPGRAIAVSTRRRVRPKAVFARRPVRRKWATTVLRSATLP